MRQGPQTTGIRRIGQYGRILPYESGFIWQSGKHFKVLSHAGFQMEDVPVAKVPRKLLAMGKDAWFVHACDGACGPHGTGQIINRVERSDGKTTKIAGPESEIVFAEVLQTQLLWATFGPYGATGELKRVPTAGGTVETLWKGAGVNAVLVRAVTAFVADDQTVSAVNWAVTSPKPVLLAKDLRRASGLAADGTHAYIVDAGDRGKQNGTLLRVPFLGGAVETLATALPEPNVVAVDDDHIYFMGDDGGNVWVMPKQGGKPTILIPAPPKDWPCRYTQWLHVDEVGGLEYLRMSRGFDTGTGEPINWGTLWAIQRGMMQDPVKQFADFMATQAGSGSAAP
jgi:hypothetical protein